MLYFLEPIYKITIVIGHSFFFFFYWISKFRFIIVELFKVMFRGCPKSNEWNFRIAIQISLLWWFDYFVSTTIEYANATLTFHWSSNQYSRFKSKFSSWSQVVHQLAQRLPRTEVAVAGIKASWLQAPSCKSPWWRHKNTNHLNKPLAWPF